MTARFLSWCAAAGCLVAGGAVAIPPVVAGQAARCPVRAQPVHAATCGATGSVAAGFLLLFLAFAFSVVAVVAAREMGRSRPTDRPRGHSGSSDRDNE